MFLHFPSFPKIEMSSNYPSVDDKDLFISYIAWIIIVDNLGVF